MSSQGWQPVRLIDVRAAPDKGLEPEDPFELIGVPYPADPDSDRAAAVCIVEEYALVGWRAADVRGLFTSPVYAALYALFRRHGPQFVEEALAAVYPDGGDR